MTVTKTCKTCAETRPLDQFHKGSKGDGGVIAHCAGCWNPKERAR